MKKVVVILPTFNEKKNIGRFIDEVLAEEKNVPGWKIEVLVVDSNSPDGTYDFVENLAKKNPKIHLISVGPGLGTALIKGHQYSLGHFSPDAMAQLDADGQVGADVLPRMLGALDDGYNLAVGSRFVRGGKNLLSPSRKFFTWASSAVSRIIMGPFDIKEWSNSARAFTPELFKKIDLNLVPWQEKTFIIQPAFLQAAVQAGARYKEIPLIFKNRAEGYSKMKVLNYSYDVLTYSLDVRLHKLGINFPLFAISRNMKTFIKFGIVGFTGTVIDLVFYNVFIRYFNLPPATSKVMSAEIAIVNNFLLNNAWTFRHRNNQTKLLNKFLMFNLFSSGGVAIAGLMVKTLHILYGDGKVLIGPVNVPYYEFYFLATIPVVMTWNFTINHFITWKHNDSLVKSA